MESNRKSNNGLIGALAALLILATGAAIYFFLQTQKYTQEVERMDTTVDSLENVRSSLIKTVDSLNNEYYAIAIENDSLKGSLDNAKEILTQKDNQIWRLNRNAKRDAETLKAEINTLQNTKNELAGTINRLKTENEELKTANADLTQQVATMTEENTSLQGQVEDMNSANQVLEQRMTQLVDASFKTSGMQIDALRKNGKSTIKARQVTQVNVGFDLVDVPEEYHGAQNIYLTITDSNGVNAIAGESNTIKVGSDVKALVIEPIDQKKVNINTAQRIEFSKDVTDKLDKGFYVVSIYSDKGLLGSSLLKLF